MKTKTKRRLQAKLQHLKDLILYYISIVAAKTLYIVGFLMFILGIATADGPVSLVLFLVFGGGALFLYGIAYIEVPDKPEKMPSTDRAQVKDYSSDFNSLYLFSLINE